MGKNVKIIIFSLIGLAVLAGVTAVLMLTAPDTDTVMADTTSVTETVTPEQQSELTLSERSADEVVSVKITNAEGTYSITPSGKTDAYGDILWTIADIAEAPLDTDALANAVNYAAAFDAKEFAEEVTDSSELAKYGLADPVSSVTVKFTDDSEFSFHIGNAVPTSSTSVYMTPDGKNVYTCYKSRTDCYSNGKLNFVDLTVMPEYDQAGGEEVQRLTIERIDLDEPLIIENIVPEEENAIQVYTYRLVSPYTAYADLKDAPNFMYSIFGLEASRCEWVGMTDTDYELAGINQPNCTITVETNRKTYTLTLGTAIAETNTDENGNETKKIVGFYGVSSEVPDILFRFDSGSITAVNISPEQLISRLFLMPYIYSLSDISYTDKDGRSIDIEVETIPAKTEDSEDVHNFYLGGEKVTDDQPIKNIYQYFISASGDDLYFDENKGELLAEIVYTYVKPTDGVDGKDVVRFYSSNTDRKVIINLNGENLFKTKLSYATQLFSNVDNFLNGEEIVLTY